MRAPLRPLSTARLAAGALAAVLAGCATPGGPGFGADPTLVGGAWTGPGVDLAAYATFDVVPVPPGAARRMDPSFASFAVDGAIASRLSGVGLARAISGSPDLLVAYWQGGTVGDVAAFGYSAGAVPGAFDVAGFPSSTLVVDLVDARTRVLAWRGAAAGALTSREAVGPALARLLPGWPPPGGR